MTLFRNRYGHDDFRWQPRFHDRIIRDRTELLNIRAYIVNNPTQCQQN
ncbi:MAG: hypothetical protein HC895_14815 [Leptolyngbyaceae cyanobacterium SM1_3_5]|nr:hypothetical protein [Leptolyngbyaceae cyanobacterium SM1_3_5]